MGNKKDQTKKIIEGIKQIVERQLDNGAEAPNRDDRAEAAVKAIRRAGRLTREKLDRAASV